MTRIMTRILAFLLLGGSLAGQTMPHGKDFKLACILCHRTTSWEVKRDSLAFDHGETAFPLTGAHRNGRCRDCHTTLVFKGTSAACISCHTDVHAGELGASCTDCHTSAAWIDKQKFREHHQELQFPLTGVHALLDCDDCHPGKTYRFAVTPVSCYDCHRDVFETAVNPNHLLAGFDRDCSECHTPAHTDWKHASYRHIEDFPLQGGHGELACSDCHTNQYRGTDADCAACHEDDYNATSDPAHAVFGFPRDCRACHTIFSWEAASFDHESRSGFALNGIHGTIQCVDCHVDNRLTGLPRDCYGCHESDYLTAADPDHLNNHFDLDCLQCHDEWQWSPSVFDHSATALPLSGIHATLECIECHVEGYGTIAADCWSCHEQDYTGVADPDHAAHNFSRECNDCHSFSGWQPATFDHTVTAFPLTGAHATLNCIECHIEGYQNTPSDCWSCHEQDYTGTTDPDHASNAFSHECSDCHSVNSWQPATFDHTVTAFPLTGAHATLNCIECHIDGYQYTPSDCWSCHEQDYTGTTDPDHGSNNFSHECTDCHSYSAWQPATFDHASTAFPLSGVHATLTCIECHAGGYQNTPSDCWSCHEQDYTGTTDPDHAGNTFSHECTDCHSFTGWQPATFDHASTEFPLTGAHAALSCIECHAGGYENTPRDCWSCHESDYKDAQAIDHQAAHFSLDCSECHTTAYWIPADWNHDVLHFRIYSGEHRNDWNSCADCHTNSSDFSVFSCLNCHEHSQSRMDDKHDDVSGYSYNSAACYSCHPRV